jgi:hypothetical protein
MTTAHAHQRTYFDKRTFLKDLLPKLKMKTFYTAAVDDLGFLWVYIG